MPAVILKSGHVQPVWSGHPWVYAQAVSRIEGGAVAGDEVDVLDPRSNFLGRGFYSPGSAIPVRIASRDRGVHLDNQWLRAQLQRASALRATLGLPNARTDGYRLVNAEGDGLPGLVVDRFGSAAAVQLTTIGMHRRREQLFDLLESELGVRDIVDRTPSTHAKTEGIETVGGVVRGRSSVTSFQFKERGLAFEIPIELGQKTGYYFDQRPARGRVEQLARGRSVLDTYCFVGSFAMSAIRGGATRVVAVDENALAVEVGAQAALRNGVSEALSFVRQSAREALGQASREGGYDIVILDPPRFAPSQRSADKALVTYRKIAHAGCKATKPGGLLLISCCSAAVSLDALTRAVALGARDAGAGVTVLERLFQGADHPVPAAFAGGLYLKSVIARVDAL